METQRQRNNKSMVVGCRLMAAMCIVGTIFDLIEGESWSTSKIIIYSGIMLFWLLSEFIYKRFRQKVIENWSKEPSPEQIKHLMIMMEELYKLLPFKTQPNEQPNNSDRLYTILLYSVLYKSDKKVLYDNYPRKGYKIEIFLDAKAYGNDYMAKKFIHYICLEYDGKILKGNLKLGYHGQLIETEIEV